MNPSEDAHQFLKDHSLESPWDHKTILIKHAINSSEGYKLPSKGLDDNGNDDGDHNLVIIILVPQPLLVSVPQNRFLFSLVIRIM